jgi:uncharacterized membrane protein YoaK (UPF0700 family)
MTSGNLRQCVIALRQWLTGHDHGARQRATRYAAGVGSFTAGAMVGVICTRWLGTPAIAFAAALLAVVLGLLIRETRQLEHAPSPRA